ncbi:MAG: ATP-binding cassette domain-containing protein [Actinomycetales bacterium]|nr:ATP-binding cassette domain-containing protein [Actinomycetales bacterium]
MSGLTLAGRVDRGSFTAEVDLTVAAGEVHAILGPNGAGKSTVLRTVAGFEALSTGRLTLGAVVLDDAAAPTFVPPAGRRVGTVFQDHRLFPHLSALENVAFGARSRGVPRGVATAHAHEWLERLGVEDLAARRPAQLSGGQAQRVAIARTLAAEPRALVLDEPLAALDVHAREEVRDAFTEHLRDFTGPVLLVTHDFADAVALADRVTVLDAGRVVQTGTVAQVAAAPGTDYVARVLRGTGGSPSSAPS